ncbi:MAG: hypothetical protein JWP10_1874 [Nocardioidaceae bacterium]|nr:hypothetical protein [Nocardioidaceae bacterium]
MRRGDDGTATIEFVWLALLLLVPLVYVLLAVFDVQRAAYGVSAASRAATRAYILAPDNTSANEWAQRAARVALADHGIAAASVRVTCRPNPSDCRSAGSVVQVSVRASQPLPLMPSVLGDRLGSIDVSATHREPFGSFREDSE